MKISLIQRESHDAFNREDSIKTNISNLLGDQGPSFTPQDKNAMERFEMGKRTSVYKKGKKVTLQGQWGRGSVIRTFRNILRS